MNPVIAFFLLLFAISSCTPNQNSRTFESNDKIDRFALVSRHHVKVTDFDSLASLSVGNGGFAFTVDVTGLQTFPEVYENGICLGTMSDWGWHSFPNEENFRLDEIFQYFEVEGRKVPYAVQWNKPGRSRDAANYFRQNPHRLHLGNIGFELLTEDGHLLRPEDISGIEQSLNLWEGTVYSFFETENGSTKVQTVCHPSRDLIGAEIHSQLIEKGLLGIALRFPYPTGNHTDGAADWRNIQKHQSKIISKNENSAVFQHTIDTTTYFVQWCWEGNATVVQKEPHYFVLQPGGSSEHFSFVAEFLPNDELGNPMDFLQVKKSSAAHWKTFWESGGAVDFSETADPRAKELERRVVLSQYLTRIQCAGQLPPQETGLTFNSWYGKFHLEMHWWHGVHWALWNRPELLEKSLGYYSDIFEKAKTKAGTQGYKGVRWPKMTDPDGNDSPSGVGEFLIWQQPHIIYFAELVCREKVNHETLEKYAPLVFETAEFMADFARWDAANNRYILGPPLIPAQESLEKEKTFNPPFEIAYWHWGLSVAQKWRQRMGLEKDEKWQKVIDDLPSFAQKNGLYLAAESAPDSYENEHYYSDHPMVLGAFGLLPETMPADRQVMENTFDYIAENWNWPRTWGWDYPMAAICATRLGKPEQAVELLLKDVQKNTYLANGHNFQDDRLRIYLPGNGGLLWAVAAMCTGFEGNESNNPGFPENWKVKWENISPPF
ncbi:hypothetical protein SAMN05444274_104451 [Mariniphaga anaerophila]|uniref:Glycosyl hydrolase family 65, N-terminal domain n=1 Tax=Mariniphaga anaerophila TaxID=1484053 RepID=A0A1M5ASR4_9BACT|nr:hypothetical protein [Mariniphaga anaerophila]SHF33186.1 hypothetical protein SAMN05444274_104451 [Mariniphaga anaerophila]